MGYRNPYASELYEKTSLLSQKVSGQDEFFREIALMDISDRIPYSILYCIIKEIKLFELPLDKMNENDIIEKIILPLLQRIGQAKFKSDVLTQLGFKVGRIQETTTHEL